MASFDSITSYNDWLKTKEAVKPSTTKPKTTRRKVVKGRTIKPKD